MFQSQVGQSISLFPGIGVGGGISFLIAIIAAWYGFFIIRKGKGSKCLYMCLALSPALIGTFFGFFGIVQELLKLSFIFSDDAQGMGASYAALLKSMAERLYIGPFGCGLSIGLVIFGIYLFMKLSRSSKPK